jgi:hypothetical protein
MTYRIYITAVDMPRAVFESQKSKLFPKIYPELDDALKYARAAFSKGLFVHLIEGDDGTHVTAGQIKKALEAGTHALEGSPRVY